MIRRIEIGETIIGVAVLLGLAVPSACTWQEGR